MAVRMMLSVLPRDCVVRVAVRYVRFWTGSIGIFLRMVDRKKRMLSRTVPSIERLGQSRQNCHGPFHVRLGEARAWRKFS
jgi:hypothetical protein